jgi:hypothetical protein
MTFKHVKDDKSTPIFQNKNDINFYFFPPSCHFQDPLEQTKRLELEMTQNPLFL